MSGAHHTDVFEAMNPVATLDPTTLGKAMGHPRRQQHSRREHDPWHYTPTMGKQHVILYEIPSFPGPIPLPTWTHERSNR